MKNYTFIILATLLLLVKTLFSQDYTEVDRIVKNYPKFSDPDKLAKRINEDFQIPEEKARAIFTWITLHVAYDVKALRERPRRTSYTYRTEEEKFEILRKIFEDLAKQTIKKKKAVCHGYSTLYKYVCDRVGLECEIIAGTSKTMRRDIGKLPVASDHAWNAVRIGNEWKLVDATWGAGYISDDATQFVREFKDFYFFLSPEKFALNHYPEDTSWLFTEMSPEEFADLPLFFSSYFESDIEILEPPNGIIDLSENDIFRMILKNSDQDIFAFHFENERNVQLIGPIREKGLTLYELEYKKSTNTYLTVFLNTRAFAVFKIKRTS